MVSTTFDTELGGGVAEALQRALAKTGALSEKDVLAALGVCDYLHNLFRTAQAAIENNLCQGGDAKAFAAEYEQAALRLDPTMATVDKVLAFVKGSRLPPLGSLLISRYENLNAYLRSLRAFLVEAAEKASAPVPPVDWQRVREAEEAYARGETKPFRKTAGTGNGS
jgi:hypothetical protein